MQAGAQAKERLPTESTSFVGRESELAELAILLRPRVGEPITRILTLTGPAGVGKTRLAMRLAAQLEKDGTAVEHVPLSPLANARLVLPTIAHRLGVWDAGREELVQRLATWLGDRPRIVMLDNFEHLLEAAGDIAELAQSCEQVQFLVTSRAPLRISGEQRYEVRPLELPAAVSLFLQRAQAVRHDFVLTDANAPLVTEVCRRLDGLPLAVELAAARARVLPPQELAARLDEQLRLLVGGARDWPSRHQTLRAAIAWSYDLLPEERQRLFDQLAVFAGGWSAEAAEAVWTENLADADGLDLLQELVDQSLAVAEETKYGQVRFRLLEAVRQFALERLESGGDAEAARQRHARYFVDLARQAEGELEHSGHGEWFDRLEGDHDNLRAALRWLDGAGQAEAAIRLCAALEHFWTVRGYRREGQQWVEQALASGADVPPAVHASGLALAAELAHGLSEYDRAQVCFDEALALLTKVGDERRLGRMLVRTAWHISRRRQYEAAEEHLRQGLDTLRHAGDREGVARGLECQGLLRAEQGDFTAAAGFYGEALAISRDTHRMAHARDRLGVVTARLGDRQRAAELIGESLAVFREIGDRQGIVDAVTHLAAVAIEDGDRSRAVALCMEGLDHCRVIENRWRLPESLETLARALPAGNAEAAATLLGASDAVREAVQVFVSPAGAGRLEATSAAIRKELGEEVFERAWARGRAMSVEETVDLAAKLAHPVPADAASGASSPLTPREQEVAALIAQGLTNQQIADTLIIAEGTVRVHVDHILGKLGYHSRSQVAAWAVQRGMHTELSI